MNSLLAVQESFHIAAPFVQPTGLRISGGRTRELARVDGRTLQPLDGRRDSAGQRADGNAQRRWRGAEPLHLSTLSFFYPTFN